MTELFIRRPITVPPPYEGGGQEVVGAMGKHTYPLFHLPLHKGKRVRRYD